MFSQLTINKVILDKAIVYQNTGIYTGIYTDTFFFQEI